MDSVIVIMHSTLNPVGILNTKHMYSVPVTDDKDYEYIYDLKWFARLDRKFEIEKLTNYFQDIILQAINDCPFEPKRMFIKPIGFSNIEIIF